MPKFDLRKKLEEHDKRFDNHDKRFDNLDKRLNDHNRRFDIHTKMLLDHNDRLQRIEDTMATKSDMNNILSILDGIAKTTTETNSEVKIINHRTQRMEKWIEKAAVKINLPYNK